MLRVFVPSIKVTVPVGVPPVAGATVTTKLIHWLNTLGFGLAVKVVVVAAGLMVCDKTLEVLAVVLASPLYAAVMECEPAPRVETESWPELFVRLTVPRSVVPSENETLPPAVPPKAGCTEAVKVTTCPTGAGLALEETVVVVVAGFTTSDNALDVLPARFEFPLYTAVIECVPASKDDTANCAALLETVAVPTNVEPSKNVTVPVAEAPEGG